MPELPEVQTIVNDLNQKVVGAIFSGFWTDWPKSLKNTKPNLLDKSIRGLRVQKVDRLGKNIIFELSENKTLSIHQKMTGHLLVGKWSIKKKSGAWQIKSALKGALEEPVNQYIHAIFFLRDGRMIALSDMRKFARISFGIREEVLNEPNLKSLGPDALDPNLSPALLKERIGSKKKPIKQALMDPSFVAGIGNIYADDILWSSKVHPRKSVRELTGAELAKILRNTRRILNKAISLRGTSVGDYRDTAGEEGRYSREVLVYRKTGQPCKRCKSPIERIVLGQRSTHFCPQCQKL